MVFDPILYENEDGAEEDDPWKQRRRVALADPPDGWKEITRKLVNRESTLRVLKRGIKNSNHPAWLGALRFAAEHAYGKPSQDLTITAKLTLEDLVAKSNETASRVDAAEPAEVLSIESSNALPSPARRYLTRGGTE